MKRIRVLMASFEGAVEQLFLDTIEGAGHHLTIFDPRQKEMEFLEEARSGGYDVVILTNLGLSLDYSLGFIAPLRQSCSAEVIVMSGYGGIAARHKAYKNGVAAFYLLPLSPERILEAVESAAGVVA
jgi:DNA-binding NtrC family response regulator